MDQEILAASVPLPVSTAATPYSSPLSRSQRWLQGALYASPSTSPSNDRLSIIEVVPPTPPRGPRQFRPIPMDPTDEDSPFPPPPSSPSPSQYSAPGTPRTPRTPGGGGHRTRKMMNRMSKTFHAGTPPPATRMLHPDDAKHTPISNTFLRDGKRSSIVGNSPGSRRHSVVSVKAPWGRDSRVLEEGGELVEEIGVGEEEEEEEEEREERRRRRRPRIEHRETTSDETYVSGGNWRTSSSTNNNTLAKAMRVDPLTALERRRRRDYTLGSHHPLRGPPNTPTGVGSSRRLSNESDIAEEEVQSVEWGDIVERFRSVWRRFGDMPWIADPCVATLVIPHTKASTSTGVGSHSAPSVVPWYRPKPTLDEMLEEGQAEGEGTGDDGSETLAHFGASPQNPKHDSKGIPRKPPPVHHAGRDLFGDNLVIRGIVNR